MVACVRYPTVCGNKSVAHCRWREIDGRAVRWRDRVRFGCMLATKGAFIAFARTKLSGLLNGFDGRRR